MKALLRGGPADGKTVDIDARYHDVLFPVIDDSGPAWLTEDDEKRPLPPPTFRAARYSRKPGPNPVYEYTGNLEE